MKGEEIGFFDRQAEWSVVERALPHWAQAGALCFVTWRAADALPATVLARLDREISELLRGQGLDPTGDWKRDLGQRNAKQRGQIQWKLFATRDKFLDQGYGECLRAQPELSKIVENSLRIFDEDRYFLTDAVVMPNHVHFIAAFRDESTFLKQNTEWKRFSARAINKHVGRRGEYWQVDQFDHLVRSPHQFDHYRRYIADNPKQAKCSAEKFRHYQKELASPHHVVASLRDADCESRRDSPT